MTAFSHLLDLLKARQPDKAAVLDPTRLNLGVAQGVTPGGATRDHEGQAWYLKYHDSDGQRYSEQLANATYRAAKVTAPHTLVAQYPAAEGGPSNAPSRGKLYASKFEPKFRPLMTQGFDSMKPEVSHAYLRNSAVDAFLATEDHHDENVGTIKGSKGALIPTRVDNGIAVLHTDVNHTSPVHKWQPSTAHRQALHTVGSPHKNPLDHYEYVQPGVKRLNAIRKRLGSWQVFVDRAIPSAPTPLRTAMASQFEHRHEQLHQLAEHLRSGKSRADFQLGPARLPQAPSRSPARERPEAATTLTSAPSGPKPLKERLQDLRANKPQTPKPV